MSTEKTSRRTVDLVRKVQGGDDTSFAALYELFFPSTYYLAFKYLKDEELAAEITQDVFVSAYENIRTLSRPIAFHKWINSIAYNKCLNHLKSQRSEREHTVDATDRRIDDVVTGDTEYLPSPALEDKEQKELLLKLMDELPLSKRTPLYLHYYEGFSATEIAQMTNEKPGSVRKRLFDARKELKQKIESVGAMSLGVSMGPSIAKALDFDAGRVVNAQTRSEVYTNVANLVGLRAHEPIGALVTGSAIATKTLLPTAKIVIAAISTAVALGGGVVAYTQATSPDIPGIEADATASTSAPLEHITSVVTSVVTHEGSVQARSSEPKAAPRVALQETEVTPQQPAVPATPPTITVDSKTVTYPFGAQVSLERILADARVSAHDARGARLSVTAQLYEQVDFQTPGQYVISINAQDQNGIAAKTAVVVVVIEEPQD